METHKEKTLRALSTIPTATTAQLATMFDNLSPCKRASETLCMLEKEKLVTGERMGDMQKRWMLTRKGKSMLNVTFPRGSLVHTLAIGDVYFKLLKGDLRRFVYEPREKYTRLGKEVVYAPDAFAIYNKRAYIIEVQLKPLSRKEWAKKWGNANQFFNEPHYEKATFQRFKKVILPEFMAVTNQKEDIVREGFQVKGRILKILNPLKIP